MFLKPDYNLNNVYEINFEELKQQGIKCIMFDLDSTVMVSKAANFLPETVEWFNTFIKDFEVAIISNNNSETYIENASKLAPCRVIGKAAKPNPKVMAQYLEEVGISPENAVMVGDRPLTDILAGKKLGCKTILVGSINPKENLPTKFVRALERSTIRK
ncbi:MAG: YqeG family HAD IIIA-type phosphatase [Candidatus Gastranaerophilales bacterium]|nr:YqeG family HAD IIIA-type phosphatase [Candidatus Gastranaerophilales bacterium]